MEAREGRFDELPAEEPYDGVSRCSFDGDGATVIEEGEVELTVGDRTIRLEAGSWSVVAPDVEHGIRAGEGGAKLLAIVVPRRTSSTAYSVAR